MPLQPGFFFCQEDFIGMPSLPLYRKNGKISDLPVDSIVSVFFAMSYPKRIAGASIGPSGSASFNNVLSFNIHFVIYYSSIPNN